MTRRWHHCCTTLSDVRERCRVDTQTGCWHWLGSMTVNGTPRMYAIDLDRSEKRVMPAQRGIWMIANGHPIGTRLVYRSCFVTDCVNPAHLRTAADRAEVGKHLAANGKRRGTSVEQRRANVAKAMAAIGIVPTAPDVVRAIRAAPPGVTGRSLAAAHGIAEQTVSRIRGGRSHRHLLP